MSSKRKYWLDAPKNVDKVAYGLYAFCAVLVLLDLFYHKHTHFPFESWFGFFGGFGFVAYVSIVLSAKVLRLVVRREEDYYDR